MSELTEMVARFNHDYFGGRKPAYRVLFRSVRNLQGICVPRRRFIVLSSALRGDELAAVLLHEMCHIGCIDRNPRFQERLRRLIPLVSDLSLRG